MNLDFIKKTLSMVGIDLSSYATQAAPAIISQIDDSLADIHLADGETKGLVITPDGHGSYYLVKVVFDGDAKNHMINKGYEKVDDLIARIFKSIL